MNELLIKLYIDPACHMKIPGTVVGGMAGFSALGHGYCHVCFTKTPGMSWLMRCLMGKQGGTGCAGHPSADTHSRIADMLQNFVANLTGWTPISTESSYGSFVYNN